MKKINYLMAFLIFFHSFRVNGEPVCDQINGNKYVGQGRYELSFQKLKNCEFEVEVTGLTLGQLSFLYGRFGEFKTKQQRINKIYTLLFKSALKGDSDALSSISGLFRYGDSLINFKPNIKKSICIDKLLNKKSHKKNEIAKCIGESPINEGKGSVRLFHN